MWPCKNPEIPKTTGCYVNVTEVNKLFAEFKAQGMIHPNGELQDMPWEMRQFSITMATSSIWEKIYPAGQIN